jgi:hypothetical protein
MVKGNSNRGDESLLDFFNERRLHKKTESTGDGASGA